MRACACACNKMNSANVNRARARVKSRKPSEPGKIAVSNMVITTQVDGIPSMRDVSDAFWGKYTRNGFAGACRIWTDNPRSTVLICSKGSMVIIAVNSEMTGMEVYHAVVKHLTSKGHTNLRMRNSVVENYASTYYMHHTLDMDAIQERYPSMMYDKRNFAGGTLRCANGLVMLVFESGNIVITGSKDPEKLKTVASWCDEHFKFADAGPRKIKKIRRPRKRKTPPVCKPWRQIALKRNNNNNGNGNSKRRCS